MGETLLDASKITLVGNVMDDLTHSPQTKKAAAEEKGSGNNHFLADQLANGSTTRFARIYGYSYAGRYYEMAVPTIFLVHGDGEPVTNNTADQTSIAAQDFDFSKDLKCWNYDQADFSIRLDMSSGPFSQILLDPKGDGSGGGVTVSGAMVSGAMVSGAMVSGAKVSG